MLCFTLTVTLIVFLWCRIMRLKAQDLQDCDSLGLAQVTWIGK